MSNLTEIVAKFGTEDKHTDLGNGFELITRHAINGTQVFVESELYKNGERIYNPIELDENEFPDDQYETMEKTIQDQKIGQMMEIPEGKLPTQAKIVWYVVGDTLDIKDMLVESGMVWESSLKAWGKLTKPDIQGVEFVLIKSYKTENGWTSY